MTLQLIHTMHESLEARWDDGMLFRYVYRPEMDPTESPKPYFHPVRSLAGNELTIYRPHDHVWHKGISMTVSHLSTQNFWGGGSYVHGEGYVQLSNNGRMQHEAWDELTCDGESFVGRERLTWITHAGEAWIAEERTIGVPEVNVLEGYWTLDFATSLTNISGKSLDFGSPTTAGRPLAGYGSLFWRGPRSFRDGAILAAEDLAGPETMGKSAAWLAYTGIHDGNTETSTLLFLDHPDNVRYPNQWFVRDTPYACVSFAFMFDEELHLAANETLALRYRIILANGVLTREQCEAMAQAWQSE